MASATAVSPARAEVVGRAPSRRGDLYARLVLFVFPIALYVPFTLIGEPLLPGDDLTQNYPLRVLTGEILRSGRFPAWDPLIWSGTPLLAGWNAGAMFPGTFLFAFLPGLAAWTINYAAVAIIASIGCYALLRRLSCSPLAAFLAAAVFTYAGFMGAQVVHIGLVFGTALSPYVLYAMDRLSTDTGRRRLAFIVLLGVSSGLIVLAGDPRAVTTTAVLALVYLLGLLYRRRGGLVLLRDVATGAILGALVSAVQWLPGIVFVRSSQRGVSSYAFFSAGSLGIFTIIRQTVLPFYAGTTQNFGLPRYFGVYNLPEVSIGMGFIALVAASAYLPRVASAAWATTTRVFKTGAPEKKERGAPATGRPLGVWYVTIVVGVLLTMGSNTPLGKVLARVPLYGGERLQNRNGELIDFALVVLLGFFLDDFCVAARSRRDQGALLPLSSPAARALGLVTPVVAIGLIVAGYLRPVAMEKRLHVLSQFQTPAFFDRLSPYLLPSLVLALIVAGFVLGAKWLPPRTALALVVVLTLADLTTYLLGGDYGSTPAKSLDKNTAAALALSSYLGKTGRFAVYDPLVSRPTGLPHLLNEMGIPDINLLKDLPSVEGYGSIVQGDYQNATGTHGFGGLLASRLAGNTFNELDLKALATLPEYFGETLPITSQVPMAGATPVTEIGEIGPTTPAPRPTPMATGPWRVAPGAEATFTISEPRLVKWVTVFLNKTTTAAPSSIGVAVEPARGPLAAPVPVPVASRQAHYYLHPPKMDNEIVVKNTSARTVMIGAVVAATNDPDLRILLDGAVQGALFRPHWAYEGQVDGMSVFVNNAAIGRAWLEAPAATSANEPEKSFGKVKTILTSPSAPEKMIVHLRTRATLVRSETYSPGWSARLTPLRGRATPRTLAVREVGLVQAVDLPAGSYRLTWHYTPSRLSVGLGASLAGILLCLVALALSTRFTRRAPQRAGATHADEGGSRRAAKIDRHTEKSAPPIAGAPSRPGVRLAANW